MLKRRTLAYAVDLLGVFFLYSSFTIALVNALVEVNTNFKATPHFSYGQVFDSFLLLLFAFCYLGYFTVSYYISNGRTMGKYLFNIKMQINAAEGFSIKESFLRASLQLLGYAMLSFPQIWAYLRADRKSLIDSICETQHAHDIENMSFEHILVLNFDDVNAEAKENEQKEKYEDAA